jgi:hypothetical protein
LEKKQTKEQNCLIFATCSTKYKKITVELPPQYGKKELL